MRLAALDLGSNSFHLLVAEVAPGHELEKVGSHKDALRLGAVVQQHGGLHREAFTAAFDSVSRMASLAAQLGASKLTTVATSALREARNGQAFLRACQDRLGVPIELLSGDDEARLAYLGARSALPSRAGRVLVADLGGGSLELAAGEAQACDEVMSLPLGFLRLALAFPLSMTGGARRLTRYVQHECGRARSKLRPFDTLLLSGGTVRAIGKLLGRGVVDVSSGQVIALCDALCRFSAEELTSLGVEKTRAQTLASGAAVIAGVLAGLGQPPLQISPRGLREGLILRELGEHAFAAA